MKPKQLQSHWTKLRRLTALAVVAMIAVGCTTSDQSSQLDRIVTIGSLEVAVPSSWVKLGYPWDRGPAVEIALGDEDASLNKTSLVVRKYIGLFDKSEDRLDQEFCDEYMRLAHTDDFYNEPTNRLTNYSAQLQELEDEIYCEITYQYIQGEQSPSFYEKILVSQSGDIYSLEAAGATSEDINLATAAARSGTLR